jgi:hypothetical protein
MNRFPSSFVDPDQLSRLLFHTAMWSGGGRAAPVTVRGFMTLQSHVREIGRSPSGGRVESLSRVLGRLPDPGDPARMAPSPASELFSACLAAAPTLLELGYPRDSPPGFLTRLPSPARNPRRTTAQVRAAMHHLGGDFELLRVLLRNPDAADPSLDAVFHAWPPPHPAEGRLRLSLGFMGQTVPAVLELGGAMVGYALLCCWDLTLRLREAEGILQTSPDFMTFAGASVD